MSGLPRGAANRIVVGGTTLTWAELPALDLPSPAVVVAATATEALAAAWHQATHGGELLITTPGRIELLRDELLAAGFSIVEGDKVQSPSAVRDAEPDRLWLLTSGSTGRPKRIGHTLASLTTVKGDQAARTWLCPYLPGTYAWWQVVTLGLTQPGQDVAVVEQSELETWPVVAAEHGVTAVSGTPTFWRQTLYRGTEELAKVPLTQITLGGEPVDQAIIDQLRAVFPDTRISWIYASSEVGAAIVVHDGRAGFPIAWLGKESPDRPTLAVDGDELVIASPHHGAGLEGAVRTGDRVEIVDDRVLVVGRLNSDEINVGGSKISAGIVRNVLSAHPGVAWARVFGRRSPVVSTIVAAEVVLRTPGAADEGDLMRWCAARLPEYGVPRRIRFLDAIPVKETLKSDV
ncbi:AMP-binding protein [Hamadaea tsunoensis]|uniref:AMP-binding protein n=1 Tax=Hamadaea tsunoensis TaxID=53368 RepID=UPI000420A736|nr:AMP-binding protein [Hamadaea tsunoensis]